VMFYFDEPDKISHAFGPVSTETGAVVENLDRLVGTLVRKLKRVERKLKAEINLIIVSDHGMGFIPEGNQVFLEDHIDLKRIKRIIGGNPVLILEPDPEYLEEAYSRLKSATHLKTWKREELPVHYHYGTHRRIPDLVVETDSAYGIEIRRKTSPAASGVRNSDQNYAYSLGTHGYDPHNTDMHGIFFASGPAFKKGYVHSTFENVHIYELLVKLLEITPAKTDGSLDEVKEMLRNN